MIGLPLPVAAAYMEYVSGNGQVARVGSAYSQPWRVHVAPFEVVSFSSVSAGDSPAVTFDGAQSVSVTADSFGLATSH